MGSPDEPNSKSIDASVGGLVWVRRRNGSWWPGRIMGLDEISEGCLVSPRSGTPVKLLGREDASVDWYNLEKSKRVKAFRCGEYDECIEKAKASAASAGKKAVKYARREDAILHALELESARLGKDHQEFCSRTVDVGEHGSSDRESPTMSQSGEGNENTNDEMSDSEDDSDSAPELSQSGISFEEPNHISASKEQASQGKRRRTPNDSEDDGTEGIKRMRGLEDLGVGVGLKRKGHVSGVPEQAQRDSGSFSDLNMTNCMSNGSPMNGSKDCTSSLKRKRSQVASVHEFLKRKNRRRPLTKVLESTAMVSVPVICDQLTSSNGSLLCGLSDSKVSVIESNESKKSFSLIVNNNSDSTGFSCENGFPFTASEHGGDVSNISNKIKETEISSIPGLPENDSADRLFDVPLVGEDKPSPGFSPILVSCSSGKPAICLGRQSSQSSQVEAISTKNEGINELVSTSSGAVHVNNCSQRIEKGASKWQLKGKRKSRHKSKNRKQDSRKCSGVGDKANAYLAGIENLNTFSQVSDGIGASLSPYNCTLQAKSKTVSEVQVDEFREWNKSHMRGSTADLKLLPDGSLTPQRSLPYRQARFMVHSRYRTPDFPSGNFCTDSSLYDVKLEVKASYKPQHVPLVSLMSKLDGKAIVGHPLMVEVLNDGHSIECNMTRGTAVEGAEVGFADDRSLLAERVPTKHMKLKSRHSSRKSKKKAKRSGLLSKKIRKLSSLTGHRQSGENMKSVVEKPIGPVIACIPLKLVFSRINEAVNGLARPSHRILASNNS